MDQKHDRLTEKSDYVMKNSLLYKHRWNCMWKNSDETIKDNYTSSEGLNACLKCLHSNNEVLEGI